MLNLKREEVAASAGVAHSTLFLFETGRRQVHPGNAAAIRAVLEAAGVEFIEQDLRGPGVRLKRARSL
jgi:transcriptional regulator with XRE-family HTH domain